MIDLMLSRATNSGPRPVTRLPSAAGARDDAKDQRDQAGDQRDQAGDQRDSMADRRDEAADRRDSLADRRDRAGTHRDEAADRRDHVASQVIELDRGSATAGDAADRAATARREAAADRRSASQDREVGADERARAGLDRVTALTDRGAGASERFQAELDRNIASADRGSGVDGRVQTNGDRSTAPADLNASAIADLEREVVRAQRHHDGLVLGFVDVDGLRAINDTLDHATGDGFLRQVADALRRALRSCDMVTRYGDAEYILSVSGMSRAEVEQRLAGVALTLAEHPGSPTVTIGFAEMSPNETARTLVDRADAAARAQRQVNRRGGRPAVHATSFGQGATGVH